MPPPDPSRPRELPSMASTSTSSSSSSEDEDKMALLYPPSQVYYYQPHPVAFFPQASGSTSVTPLQWSTSTYPELPPPPAAGGPSPMPSSPPLLPSPTSSKTSRGSDKEDDGDQLHGRWTREVRTCPFSPPFLPYVTEAPPGH